ncbi:MAG: glycosyltransferase [Gammaproteobacteria bacterium]|nr:glycosyltransferase [Gammaproteobacteria bacterium]
MRIGHINLARGFRGGERQTQLLIEALDRRNELQQSLFIRKESTLATRLASTKSLQITRVGRPFMFSASAARDCQLLHAHEGKAAHFALMANLRYGIPYIITRRVSNRPKDNYFTRQVYRRAARVVAISTAIRDYMLDYDATLPMEVIPSMQAELPVNSLEVEKLRAQYRDKFVVGHIGALVLQHKGQEYLIEAARRLEKTHPQIHFVLLGEGRDGEALRSMAKDVGNITFVGFVDNVGDYISLFDLFVFPSLEEGLGSTLLDVMSFSRPIIASNVDGIPDIVHDNKTGLLVPPQDSDALYQRIVQLHDDHSLRQRLAKAGNALVQSYRPDPLSGDYLNLYRELLK